MKIIKKLSWILLFFLPCSFAFAWQWIDLWRTADQQGADFLQTGQAEQAAKVFRNPNWQGVAKYRAGNYAQAYQQFKGQKTSDGQYNAGNAAAHLEHYQEAIDAYDKAIALNPNNTDAITNKEIIKKLMEKKKQQQNNSSSSKERQNQKKNNSSKKDSDNEDSAKNNSSNSKEHQDQEKDNTSKESDNKDSLKNNSFNSSPRDAEKNKNSETKTTQNDSQKSPYQKNQPQQQNNHSAQSQSIDGQSLQENKSSDLKPENAQSSTQRTWQAQDENQKQLLRRLPDDPGGLLRQKFLRDYLRRHSDESDGGES